MGLLKFDVYGAVHKPGLVGIDGVLRNNKGGVVYVLKTCKCQRFQ